MTRCPSAVLRSSSRWKVTKQDHGVRTLQRLFAAALRCIRCVILSEIQAGVKERHRDPTRIQKDQHDEVQQHAAGEPRGEFERVQTGQEGDGRDQAEAQQDAGPALLQHQRGAQLLHGQWQ